MIRVLSALKDVMRQEVDEYTQMLAFAEEKKEVLLKNDTAELDIIVAKEWIVLKKIKQLEAQRESLIERTEALCHVQKGSMSFQDIINVTKGEMREDMMQLKSQLSNVVLRLKGQNAANKILIETHLQYSAFCVNLLSGSINSSLNTYSHSGELSDKQENGTMLIDQSV